jgi:hypothetical protein
MHNQGVKPWPRLGFKDPRHRQIRARIAAQPVDCLGWKGDQPCGAQDLCGAGKTCVIRQKAFGFDHR